MKVEQIYTGCLSQAAYYIESEGEAAIIDPLREIKPYLELAMRDHAEIKYIFETHFHADFVSGHVSLSEETGAAIVYGPLANPSFEAIIATDYQEFKIGKLTLIAIHTPGHTMESTTYLLRDEKGEDYAIFSGDTLFLGDVGRPDLAQKANEITQEDLAGILYDSLRNKIMTLADHITVYPAHGAGSACGKHMMNETIDTLGNQKKMNYALRADMTRAEFIYEVTDGLPPPPVYFPLNVKMNREGYDHIEDIIERGTKSHSPSSFKALAESENAIILDVRHQSVFIKEHIPNSIFIGLDGGFAPWVGAMIADVSKPILLVAPKERVEEAVIRLSRVGFDHALGYLEGGINSWKEAGNETAYIDSVSAEEFKEQLVSTTPVFDVRNDNEYKLAHIPTAVHTPLSRLTNGHYSFNNDEPFYVYCAGGYRSVIAASILKSKGLTKVIDIAGGFNAIKATGIEVFASDSLI